MHSDTEKTLWFAIGDQGHYLIPDDDDIELPEGPLTLLTLLGRERSVDAAAVQAFRASEDEVTEHIKHATEQGMLAIKASVGGFLAQLGQAWADAAKPEAKPDAKPNAEAEANRADKAASEPDIGPATLPAHSEPEAAPWLSSVAAATSRAKALWIASTGQSIEDLASDPQSIARGLETIVNEFVQLIHDVSEAGDLGMARAKQRLSAFGERLRELGYTDAVDWKHVPEQLQAVFGSGPAADEALASAERMERAAETVDALAARLSAGLRKRAEQMRQQVSAVSRTPE